jgi:hypothetical protein
VSQQCSIRFGESILVDTRGLDSSTALEFVRARIATMTDLVHNATIVSIYQADIRSCKAENVESAMASKTRTGRGHGNYKIIIGVAGPAGASQYRRRELGIGDPLDDTTTLFENLS